MDDTLLLMSHPLSRVSRTQISALIRDIEELDRINATEEQVKAQLKRLFQGYSCITRIVEAKQAWRSRRLEQSLPYSHVRELWYPPSEKVKSYGRLNKPGRPMMYVSASHGAAILEMRPNVGDRFVVLQLKLKDELNMPHVMELGVAEKASQHGLETSVHLLEQTPAGREFLKNNIRKNLAIRSYLARELTQVVPRGEEARFKVSAQIAELLMDSKSIDGVLYPCMAGDVAKYGGGVNMAIKPQSADRLFVPDTCWVSRVEEYSEAGFHMRCEARARSIRMTGEIEW